MYASLLAEDPVMHKMTEAILVGRLRKTILQSNESALRVD